MPKIYRKHALKKSIYAEIREARSMLNGARDFLALDELHEAKIATELACDAADRIRDAIEERRDP